MAAAALLVALLGAGRLSSAADSPEDSPRWQSARQRPLALRRSYEVPPNDADVDDASFTDSGRRLRWKRSSAPHVRWTSPTAADSKSSVQAAEHVTAQRSGRSAKKKRPAPKKAVLRLEAKQPTSSGPRLTQLEDSPLFDEESVLQDPPQIPLDAGEPSEGMLPPPVGTETEPEAEDRLPETFREEDRTVPLIGPDQEAAPELTPQEECSQGLEAIRESVIRKIDLSIDVPRAPGEELPYECALDDETFAGRHWAETLYTWKASSLCHKPLYFEELALERYGHSKGPFVQPLYSAAHFFASLPALPYLMGLRPPKECVYALGHYRPGSCAPYLKYPIPISTRGALLQAGAVVGTAAVLP